jgi:hypothetical protein
MAAYKEPAMSVSESQARAFEGFPVTWKRVITDPHGFIADLPETGGLGDPLTFLAICAGANALGHLLKWWGIGGMIAIFLWQLVAAFLLATLFVLIAQNLFEGRGGFEPTFRVVAYAWAPLVVAWIPVIGVIAWLFSAYLIIRGLERVQRIDTVRAVLTLVIGTAVVWVLRAVRSGGPVWL